MSFNVDSKRRELGLPTMGTLQMGQGLNIDDEKTISEFGLVPILSHSNNSSISSSSSSHSSQIPVTYSSTFNPISSAHSKNSSISSSSTSNSTQIPVVTYSSVFVPFILIALQQVLRFPDTIETRNFKNSFPSWKIWTNSFNMCNNLVARENALSLFEKMLQRKYLPADLQDVLMEKWHALDPETALDFDVCVQMHI